jgi:hypothetical protein
MYGGVSFSKILFWNQPVPWSANPVIDTGLITLPLEPPSSAEHWRFARSYFRKGDVLAIGYEA